MYLEAGPVIETPLAAAQAVHEMLLQSWGDTLRVFPAVPAAWKDAAFHDLRAEGAFLVSAVRREGRTTLRAGDQPGRRAGAPCGWPCADADHRQPRARTRWCGPARARSAWRWPRARR